MAHLIVASNRGPVTYSREGPGWSTSRGGGGLVTALSTVELEGRRALWICAAMSPDDLAALEEGYGDPQTLMIPFETEQFRAAYDDVSTSTLWFAHHLLWDLRFDPMFTFSFRRDWLHYRAYSNTFAETIDRNADEGAIVLIQDYHLTLVPNLLRLRRPDLKIAHFSHTPWAPPEYLSVLPRESVDQMLTGILGADHAGFHSRRWAQDFINCCTELLGAQTWPEGDSWVVRHLHRATRIDVHPLGVDGESFLSQLQEPAVDDHKARLLEKYGQRAVIARIDRTEPSKNILRGLHAFRQLLNERPEWRGNVVQFVLAYYSRQDLAEYQAYAESVISLAAAINAEFGTDDWQPVDLYLESDMSLAVAAYSIADVLLVNPIRDGMNLVAKEGPLISNSVDHGVVVVLSQNAGAADEMAEHALIINPFDVEETAQMLHAALLMDKDERRRRTYALAQIAVANPPSLWVQKQIEALRSDVIRIEERSTLRA